LTLIYATGIVMVNLIIETLYEFMDPRVKANWEQSRN
jgi:ABC-type dipeptide/oligopeptide/nickel transport system permease component